MQFKKIAAAVSACAVVASGLVFGSAAASAAPGCPELYVVAIPGTWETGQDSSPGPGMLAGVTNGLPSSTEVDYVTYSATAFPWEGDVYGKSKNEAVAGARGFVTDMAQRCGATKIALLGYSQGADAAGDLAAEIGTGIGPVSPDRIAGVGLLSDPRRSPADAQVGTPAPGSGAGGPRVGGFGWLSDRTRTICDPSDLYCATAPDDFVIRFAGFLAQTSDPRPANLWRYQLEMGAIMNDLMANGGIPTLGAQLTESANEQRAQELEDFYDSRAHINYASYSVDGGQSAINWMHNWFSGMA